MPGPIVLVSSYPPRACGVAIFCQEVRSFIQKHHPGRQVLVVSHTDARGDGVLPLIDPAADRWWEPVAERIGALDPDVVHVQFDWGLYAPGGPGSPDAGDGFLELLARIHHLPLVLETHTIPPNLSDAQVAALHRMCAEADVVLLKCQYHRWRLDWTFPGRGWQPPTNVMIVPRGVRPDRRFGVHEIPHLRRQLGLDPHFHLAPHLVGLTGWNHLNQRWEILTGMWHEIRDEIRARTGTDWDLIAAGARPDEEPDADAPTEAPCRREAPDGTPWYEFTPRGDHWYRLMALCDFIVLPGTDDAHAGMLLRIITLNKPFVTSAPFGGLTVHTLESGGGLLFANRDMLKDAVVRLACDEALRMRLGNQLRDYLDNIVSWDIVVGRYAAAYEQARRAKLCGAAVDLSDQD